MLSASADGVLGALGADGAQGAPVPVRPQIPPVLLCALGLWASCAAVYSAARPWASGACCAGVALCVPFACILIACLLRWRTAPWCLLLGIVLGAACALSAAAALHEQGRYAEGTEYGTYRFTALEDGADGLYGSTCLARTEVGGRAVTVRLRLDSALGTVRYGDVFSAGAVLKAPSGSSAEYCWQQGAAAEAKASQADRQARAGLAGALLAVREAAVGRIGSSADGSEAGGVLAALVCGYRGALAEDGVYGDFKAAGVAHLIAVSGAHLSIVGAFAAALLQALRLPRGLRLLLQGGLLAGFLVLSAAPVSAVRAAVMAACGMASFVPRRRSASANALGICMMALIAVRPQTAVSASFALSAASTLGIVLLCGLFGGWLSRWAPALPQAVRDPLGLTMAASVCSVPLGAALFSQVSLVSPAANVACAPLFAFACGAGLACTLLAVAVPSAGAALLPLALAAAEALCAVVRLFASVPFASIPASAGVVPAVAASAVAAGALWWRWPQPRLRTAVGLALSSACLAAGIFAAGPLLAGTQIVMLDVGQGDAIVVRSGGAAVLVDTGNHDQQLREGLAQHGIYRLDAVVITHADDDHCGSLASLAGVVQVGAVCVAADARTCGCGSCTELMADAEALVGAGRVVGLSAGDRLRCGAFVLDVVWPEHFEDEGGNADSLCLLADADVDGDGASDCRALLCGDAEAEQLSQLVDAGTLGDIDVYKVGHHGARAALTPEVALAMSPEIALVSVGEGNRYGHPAPETLAALEEAGAAVFRTDTAGDIVCEVAGDAIRVSTLR